MLACVLFVDGGCNGNENNFETQALCEDACRRGGRQVDRLNVPAFKAPV